jgi:hypothetical protein
VSPAATAAPAPAPIAAATNRIHITRYRIAGTKTSRPTCHRSRSGRTCSISTWHNKPLSKKAILLSFLSHTQDKSLRCTVGWQRATSSCRISGRDNFLPALRRTRRPCGLSSWHYLISFLRRACDSILTIPDCRFRGPDAAPKRHTSVSLKRICSYQRRSGSHSCPGPWR